MSNDKFLLIKAKGGMGNRILCVLSGLLFADLSQRRPCVDWRDDTYSDNGENVFGKFFEHVGADLAEIDQASHSVSPQIWDGNIHRSVGEMIGTYHPNSHSDPRIYRKYCCDLGRTDQEEDIAIYWTYVPKIQRVRKHLYGRHSAYRAMSDDEILRDLIQSRLKVVEVVRQRVDDFVRCSFSGPMIGVHIRYTDKRTPVHSFERHVERIRSKSPDLPIFLATDNPLIEDHFRQKFGRVVVTSKWFPKDGSHLHQNPDCPDKVQSGIEALVDMYLLARCKYLVYAKSSTFSYISYLLSDICDSNVFNVEKYDAKAWTKHLVQRWA